MTLFQQTAKPPLKNCLVKADGMLEEEMPDLRFLISNIFINILSTSTRKPPSSCLDHPQ